MLTLYPPGLPEAPQFRVRAHWTLWTLCKLCANRQTHVSHAISADVRALLTKPGHREDRILGRGQQSLKRSPGPSARGPLATGPLAAGVRGRTPDHPQQGFPRAEV